MKGQLAGMEVKEDGCRGRHSGAHGGCRRRRGPQVPARCLWAVMLGLGLESGCVFS